MYCCIGSLACLLALGCTSPAEEPATLKDVLKDKFLIGTALNLEQIWERDTSGVQLIDKQFNAIVAENCMKSMYLQPQEGLFFFEDADRFVQFGTEHGLVMTGHTLIWHQQAPEWFFTDENGKDVSREVLLARMKSHIQTVVGRYKGRIKGWDVVNEAFEDDGSFRQSKFYQIIGEDYIHYAFQYAAEADPGAALYYNDFSMAKEGKCRAVAAMVKRMQAAGIRIDGVGMQGHLIMSWPGVDEFEKSLLVFSELGVKVMITELDLSVLPSPRRDVGADLNANFEYMKEMNPYAGGLPDSVAQLQQQRYADFFHLFLKHSGKIERVTLWGVADGDSWRNDWPMHGRTDYALLFDRNHQAKPVVDEIIRMAVQ